MFLQNIKLLCDSARPRYQSQAFKSAATQLCCTAGLLRFRKWLSKCILHWPYAENWLCSLILFFGKSNGRSVRMRQPAFLPEVGERWTGRNVLCKVHGKWGTGLCCEAFWNRANAWTCGCYKKRSTWLLPTEGCDHSVASILCHFSKDKTHLFTVNQKYSTGE